METKKKTTPKMDLLSAVEKVVELSKGSHLEAEFFRKAARPIKYIADKLELTKEQSVMMALFIDNSSDTSIRISDFAEKLECSTTRILRFMKDVDELANRGYNLSGAIGGNRGFQTKRKIHTKHAHWIVVFRIIQHNCRNHGYA